MAQRTQGGLRDAESLLGQLGLLRYVLLAGVSPERLELTNVSPTLRAQLPRLARTLGKEKLLHWHASMKSGEQQLRNIGLGFIPGKSCQPSQTSSSMRHAKNGMRNKLHRLGRTLQGVTRTEVHKHYKLAAQKRLTQAVGYSIGWLLGTAESLQLLKGCTDLVLCTSTINLLLNYSARHDSPQVSIFFSSFCNDISWLADSLNIDLQEGDLQTFVRMLWVCAKTGTAAQVWLPHISTDIMPPSLTQFMLGFAKAREIYYYDDGMSAISSSSYLHRLGLLPHQAIIHTWDYSFLSLYSPHAVAFAKVEKGRQLILQEAPHLAKIQGESLHANTTLGLVIASRNFDYAALKNSLPLKTWKELYYLPHYSASKNNEELLHTTKLLKIELLEIALLETIRTRPVVLYFAVTSSLLFIFEILSKDGWIGSSKFIFTGHENLVPPIRKEEYKHYLRA